MIVSRKNNVGGIRNGKRLFEGIRLGKETIDSIMVEHGKSIQNEKDKVTSAEAEETGLKASLRNGTMISKL